jgi:hypothetical protein
VHKVAAWTRLSRSQIVPANSFGPEIAIARLGRHAGCLFRRRSKCRLGRVRHVGRSWSELPSLIGDTLCATVPLVLYKYKRASWQESRRGCWGTGPQGCVRRCRSNDQWRREPGARVFALAASFSSGRLLRFAPVVLGSEAPEIDRAVRRHGSTAMLWSRRLVRIA